jgi:hypothetical protein
MARKPNLSTESIKREILADNAERKAKAAARRMVKRDAAKAEKAALVAKTEQTDDQRAARKAEEAKAALESMRVDFVALFDAGQITEGTSFEAWLAEQGFNPDGSVKEAIDAPAPKAKSELGYQGPMLALRDAAKHYVTGKNGNPHCADNVAVALDGLTREQVVSVVGNFLKDHKVIDSTNPYAHLNPGQQSMNLRNKLRGALKAGLVTIDQLKATVQLQKVG